MTNINDGGPAFPMPASEDHLRGDVCAEYGMSLRDWFAGMALQGLIAKSPFLAEPQTYEVYEKTAIGAYDYADAMLKARGEE